MNTMSDSQNSNNHRVAAALAELDELEAFVKVWHKNSKANLTQQYLSFATALSSVMRPAASGTTIPTSTSGVGVLHQQNFSSSSASAANPQKVAINDGTSTPRPPTAEAPKNDTTPTPKKKESSSQEEEAEDLHQVYTTNDTPVKMVGAVAVETTITTVRQTAVPTTTLQPTAATIAAKALNKDAPVFRPFFTSNTSVSASAAGVTNETGAANGGIRGVGKTSDSGDGGGSTVSGAGGPAAVATGGGGGFDWQSLVFQQPSTTTSSAAPTPLAAKKSSSTRPTSSAVHTDVDGCPNHPLAMSTRSEEVEGLEEKGAIRTPTSSTTQHDQNEKQQYPNSSSAAASFSSFTVASGGAAPKKATTTIITNSGGLVRQASNLIMRSSSFTTATYNNNNSTTGTTNTAMNNNNNTNTKDASSSASAAAVNDYDGFLEEYMNAMTNTATQPTAAGITTAGGGHPTLVIGGTLGLSNTNNPSSQVASSFATANRNVVVGGAAAAAGVGSTSSTSTNSRRVLSGGSFPFATTVTVTVGGAPAGVGGNSSVPATVAPVGSQHYQTMATSGSTRPSSSASSSAAAAAPAAPPFGVVGHSQGQGQPTPSALDTSLLNVSTASSASNHLASPPAGIASTLHDRQQQQQTPFSSSSAAAAAASLIAPTTITVGGSRSTVLPPPPTPTGSGGNGLTSYHSHHHQQHLHFNNNNPSHQNSGGGVAANKMHLQGLDGVAGYQVLVEFKRKRVLQFESNEFVTAGEFVVVGGDRGEDIGVVTHVWTTGSAEPVVGAWNGSVGIGKVLRPATLLEISQLQGVQFELESRAVEVAQEKVVEHQLPMRIVDAEYQFDRKKLTFYYQSNHRLDFRNLVRDLYKTFRARIWMEQD